MKAVGGLTPSILFLFCPYRDVSCLLHAHYVSQPMHMPQMAQMGHYQIQLPAYPQMLAPSNQCGLRYQPCMAAHKKSSIGAVAGHWHGIRLWSMIVWAYACLGAVSVVVPVLVCVRAADGCPMCQQCQQGHIQLDLPLPCSSQATLCLGPIPGGLL